MPDEQSKSYPEFPIIGPHSHQCSNQLSLLVPHIYFSVQQLPTLVCSDVLYCHVTWQQSNP